VSRTQRRLAAVESGHGREIVDEKGRSVARGVDKIYFAALNFFEGDARGFVTLHVHFDPRTSAALKLLASLGRDDNHPVLGIKHGRLGLGRFQFIAVGVVVGVGRFRHVLSPHPAFIFGLAVDDAGKIANFL
jgi:hypothetical protein